MHAAQGLVKLDMAAHYATKMSARGKAIDTVNEAIEEEYGV
jgi:hypothetical protein